MPRDYDYEESPKKKKYKNPDDILRTMPGVDPNRHKRGIVGFVMGITSFIAAFTLVFWVWIFSFCLAAAGLILTLLQRKIKRTKVSSAALAVNVSGLAVFAALIILTLTDVLQLTNWVLM